MEPTTQMQAVANTVLEAIRKYNGITFKTLGGSVTVTKESAPFDGSGICTDMYIFKSATSRHSISANPRHTDLSRFTAHLEGFIKFQIQAEKPKGRKVTKISSVGTSACRFVSGNVTLMVDKMETCNQGLYSYVNGFGQKAKCWNEEATYTQCIEVYVDGIHMCNSWLDRRPTKNTLKNPPVHFVGFEGTTMVGYEHEGLTSFQYDDLFGGGKHVGIKQLISAARRLA
jgi:hypothetical protein